MNIGIFGSSQPTNQEIKIKAEEVGKIIASKGYTVITGGVPGYPHIVAMSAMSVGGKAVVYAAGLTSDDHNKFYNLDLSQYTKTIFQDKYHDDKFSSIDLYERSLKMVSQVDKAIIIGGRVGTMYEVTILSGLGKDMFVLENSGGITKNTMANFINEGHKEKSEIVYFNSPEELINLI
ncbi:MAG: hypothetical protein Q7S53_00080 [bacterium]|nr:hypothetical protein [bacterium]